MKSTIEIVSLGSIVAPKKERLEPSLRALIPIASQTTLSWSPVAARLERDDRVNNVLNDDKEH